MAWVKVDVAYLRNPKMRAVSPDARLLHLASILWTAEHLTDGILPRAVLRDLADTAQIDRRWASRRALELVGARLWDDACEAWIVHDFAWHNPTSTRANVEHERQLSRDRMRRWRGSVTP